jgi:hypothetical protein
MRRPRNYPPIPIETIRVVRAAARAERGLDAVHPASSDGMSAAAARLAKSDWRRASSALLSK